MWIKLLKVIRSVLNGEPRPQKRLARAIVALYLDMLTVQDTYLSCIENHSADLKNDWREATNRLFERLRELDTILRIYDPTLFIIRRDVEQIIFDEMNFFDSDHDLNTLSIDRLKFMDSISDGIEHGFVSFNRNIPSPDTKKPALDFQKIIDGYAEFIRDNFKMEEVFEISNSSLWQRFIGVVRDTEIS